MNKFDDFFGKTRLNERAVEHTAYWEKAGYEPRPWKKQSAPDVPVGIWDHWYRLVCTKGGKTLWVVEPYDLMAEDLIDAQAKNPGWRIYVSCRGLWNPPACIQVIFRNDNEDNRCIS